ncbi:MAG: ABC transporter permease [Rhodobacterales bacterium]|nr:ABC transporter permease [Rhodobacterales bacterium]
MSGLKLISPTAIYVILLLAVPLATVILYSVLTGGRGTISLPFTFENYAQLLEKPVYGYIMLKSLLIALVVTFITIVLAYPVAYFVSFHVRPERKSLWLFLITIPFWTSYIIRVSLWFVILGYGGVVDSALASIGLEPLNIASYSILSIIIVLAHAYAPFAVLPIFVSLEKVDRSLLEAGQDLGESRWATFTRVTLPLTMPGVIASVLIVFIPTVGDYVTPKLVADGKEPMIANFIETQLLKLNNYAQGSAFAVTSMVMVAVVCLIFILLNRRFIGGQK